MRSTSSRTMSRLNARSSSRMTISAVLMRVVVRWPALRTSRRPPASLVRLCGGRGRSQGSDTTGSRQARAQARMRVDMARFNASSGSKNRTDRPAAKCPRAATNQGCSLARLDGPADGDLLQGPVVHRVEYFGPRRPARPPPLAGPGTVGDDDVTFSPSPKCGLHHDRPPSDLHAAVLRTLRE